MRDVAEVAHFSGTSPLEIEEWPTLKIALYRNELIQIWNELNKVEDSEN